MKVVAYAFEYGSPPEVGRIVLVSDAVDRHVHDVSAFIGRRGLVTTHDYKGCGSREPNDPMICLRFDGGNSETFWVEELSGLRLSEEVMHDAE